jgi:hypothetical protein
MAARSGHRDWRLVAAAAVAGLGGLLLVAAPLVLRRGPNWALDFLAYRDAASRLAAEGSLYSSLTVSGPFHPGPTGLYLYPPPMGVAVTALSWSSFEAGALLWYGLHVVCLAAACALMPVRPDIRLATFGIAALTFAVLRDLTMGNVSVLLLLPLVAGWRWLDRPAGSVALGLAASVRVSYGAFLVWMLLRRAWTSAAWMALAGLALFLVTLPFVGVDGYRDYLATIGNLSDTTGVLRNSDLASAALALGVPLELAGLALYAGYLAAVAAIALSLRRDTEVGYMVTLGATMLLAPLLWDHYLSALLLPAAFLAQRGRPWALGLPLLSWLPAVSLPFVALLAVILPFLARDAGAPLHGQRAATRAAPEQAPAQG